MDITPYIPSAAIAAPKADAADTPATKARDARMMDACRQFEGQFFDMMEIFKIGGWCPDTNYLFLGTSDPSKIYSPVRIAR